jgi:Conserved hypothetical protein 2217 (DUF2460)
MATFPALSSGSTVQYPLQTNAARTTQVIRFLDGTDQRCIVRARPMRWWVVKITLLNDSELAQMEEFFVTQQGNFGRFDFTDPSSGEIVPNCRLVSPELVSLYQGADQGSMELTVMECYV